MPDFIRLAVLADLPPGTMKKVVHRRKRIALYNVGGQVYATDDTCTHAEASLTEGRLAGCEVSCPLHGARFNVQTGQALSMPATVPVETYAVKVEDGAILVCL